MRLNKTIKITKGLSINFSKSAISLTIKIKGVSLHIGTNGIYLTTYIPGTGLSNRKKLWPPEGKTKTK